MNGTTGSHCCPRRQVAMLATTAAGLAAVAAACGMGLAWQVMWWWPAGAVQP